MVTYFIRFFLLSIVFMGVSGFADPHKDQNLPQIVAFLGPKRVGKDTSADFLIRCYGYEKYALADPVKKAVQAVFHFSEEQLWGDAKEIIDPYWGVTPREVMQFIGIDTLYDRLSIRFPHLGHTVCLRSLQRWQSDHPKSLVVISDLRMQEDVNALKEMGALIIRIERPGIVSEDTHVSEAHVSFVTGDDLTIINNGSIKELEEKLDKVMRNFR